MNTEKKPKVKLVGTDGNVFSLIGKCSGAMRQAGVPKETISEFNSKVFSAESYDHALRIMMEYCDVS